MNDKNTPADNTSKVIKMKPQMKADEVELYQIKPRFEVNNKGVFWIAVRTSKDGGTTEAEPMRLADAIDLIGSGQDATGNYYRVIRWQDRLTKQFKTAAIPCAEIGSNQGWQRLQSYGLVILNGRAKRERLADYLLEQGNKEPYTITEKAGWHGKAYILPSGEILYSGNEEPRIIYMGDTSQAKAYQAGGTLETWQQQIASHAAGNSRLCLALGISFAAPLLSLLHEESGGFHLYGDSSDGKTTAAKVALSVWAKPSESLITWQGTSLSFSNTATARNDGLVVLDEIGQAKPSVISSTVYGVMNGSNKGQAAKDGGNRALSRWRVLMLSTGEKTPDSILSRNEDWNAGQAARLPSIPAAARYGIYDTLHGFDNGALLSEHLKEATELHHGEAGRAFIRLIDGNTPAAAQERINAFMAALPELSGQARRVAKRFALVSAAIELAAPVTGLPIGVGMAGVKQCFDEWLERNGTGKFEDERILKQAIDFMQSHAYGQRFADWGNKDYTDRDHAGYRKRGEHEQLDEYWIIPAVFESEICQKFEATKVCTVLHSKNWLLKTKDGRWKHLKRGQGRHYILIGIEPAEEADKQE